MIATRESSSFLTPFKQSAFVGLVVLSFFLPHALAERPSCSDMLSNSGKSAASPRRQATLKGGQTLKDLEPVFKSLIAGEEFDLVIPKGVELNLFRSEGMPHRMGYGGGRVEHYPYELEKALTADEKRLEDLLVGLADTLRKIEREQQALRTHWSGLSNTNRFSPSPTTGKSRALFKRPQRVLEIVDQQRRLGPSPWVYLREDGASVITNRHYLEYMKARGSGTVRFYRGHYGFDYHFYRLLLESDAKGPRLRREFADWLRAEKYNLKIERQSSYARIEVLADKLDDSSIATVDLLLEMGAELTTSVMFTSLTTNFTGQWISANRELNEVLTLTLDFDKMPEWYLEQVLFGGDLDAEVVFPFATLEQILALRASLKVEKRKSH